MSDKEAEVRNLVLEKKERNNRYSDLNAQIKSERELLHGYKKNLSMFKCRTRFTSSIKKKIYEADIIYGRNIAESTLKILNAEPLIVGGEEIEEEDNGYGEPVIDEEVYDDNEEDMNDAVKDAFVIPGKGTSIKEKVFANSSNSITDDADSDERIKNIVHLNINGDSLAEIISNAQKQAFL